MLVPNDAEKRLLRIYHPWLARLRGSAHRFNDDEEKYLALIEQAQSELLLRIRFLAELNEMRNDAYLVLKYAIRQNSGCSIVGQRDDQFRLPDTVPR